MSRPLHQYDDIHTHLRALEGSGRAVVNITPGDHLTPGGHYSIGIHPWDTAGDISCTRLRQLVATAADERVKAIGEAGFDRLHGGDTEAQMRLFRFHARLAEQVGKPLIIHCVRAWDLLFEAAAQLRPEPGMWIIHGFRGKPQLAEQLLRRGMAISLGNTYNPATAAIIPPDRLYRETDAIL